MFHLNGSNNLPMGFLTSAHDPLLSGLHRQRSFYVTSQRLSVVFPLFMEINKIQISYHIL